MTEPIVNFIGKNYFMSNFVQANVGLDGLYYPTVENAYQAAKTLEHGSRVPFTQYAPAKAKRMGRRLNMREDWYDVRLAVMEGLLRQKFTNVLGYNIALRRTGDAELVEGNYWRDTFWGVCNGVGENQLGKLLMKIRAELFETYGPLK